MSDNYRFTRIVNMQIVLVVFLIIFANFGVSALLGVNRVSLTYNDVLRGGYAQDNVVITIGSDELIPVNFEAKGDIKEWIRFEPLDGPLLVNKDNSGMLKIIVEPPIDSRVGAYEGKVLITTGSLGQVESEMGSSVEVAFELKIVVIISDTQILSCNSGGFEIKDSEIGQPNEFFATIMNNGNVRIKPLIEFKIFDQLQEQEILSTSYLSKNEILPTTSQEIIDFIELNLSKGQYWVEIKSSECSGDGALRTFSILEKGEIGDVGEFVRIDNLPWASTKELIPIVAHFRNRGERSVSAQFKGTISKDGKIIQVLESDILTVAPQETVPIEMFFSPKDIGQYKINGRVYYNNKITFQKGSIINVNPSNSLEESNGEFMLSIILSVLIVIIAVFVFLIIKRKKNKWKAFKA